MLYTYDIKYFKFALANIAQVKRDFSGGNAGIIFINGLSLKEIYKKMDLVVETADNLHDDNLYKILKEYCFKNVDENQFFDWEKLAQTLFHQGGLLNAFEAALREKMSIPDKDGKAYIPQVIKKEVHISFANQRLAIQENFTFKKIQDSLEEGNYQLKAQVVHYVSLNAEKKEFLYQMELPVFKCQNSKLQKFLQQKRLSIHEILNIIISKKIFRIPFVPNRSSFFQNPYHQCGIGLDKIAKKESNNNILVIDWETITPTNRR
jgi:hypothetical protein